VVDEVESERKVEDEPIPEETPIAPDIDSDDVDEDNEEQMLFATLKQKIKETVSGKKQKDVPKEEEDELKEVEPRHIVS
jgi:hypothetical protein